MRLAIDAAGYDSAAEALARANREIASSYDVLTGKLSGFAAMGGDDRSSEDFVKGYDDAAAEVVGGIAELTTAFATLSTLTAMSGANHRRANAGSVFRRPSEAGDTSDSSDDVRTVRAFSPPSSLGADSQDVPEFWNLIVDHLQGWAWPSADVDKLRDAAGAWRAVASDLDASSADAAAAKPHLSTQRSPEISVALTHVQEVSVAATDLATECRGLADSCEEYAAKVETTRNTISGLLKDLAIEIGATAVVSGLASLVTFGGAAVVGGGVATARAISCARKIIAAIKAIKAIKAIAVLARTLPKARGVRSALKKFQNIKAARRAAKQIDNQLWSPGKWKSNPKNALKHFNKHKDEFPELRNAKEYTEAAKKFMTDPPPGTYTRVRESDGAIVRYDPGTNTFGVMSKDGVMNTMFKPDPSKLAPKFKDAWDYFLHHKK